MQNTRRLGIGRQQRAIAPLAAGLAAALALVFVPEALAAGRTDAAIAGSDRGPQRSAKLLEARWAPLSEQGVGGQPVTALAGASARRLLLLRASGLVETADGSLRGRTVSAPPPEVDGLAPRGVPALAHGRGYIPLSCVARTPGCRPAVAVIDATTLSWLGVARVADEGNTWLAASADGRSLWTASGDDLVEYPLEAIDHAAEAGTASAVAPIRRLRDAVPAGTTAGAARDRRLLLAGASGRRLRVWAIDPSSGRRTLELRARLAGEVTGIAADLGELRLLIAAQAGRPASKLRSYVRIGYRISAKVAVDGARLRITAALRYGVWQGPLSGATVRLRARSALTDATGTAFLPLPASRDRLVVTVAKNGLVRVAVRLEVHGSPR